MDVIQNFSDPSRSQAKSVLVVTIAHAIADGTTLVEVLFSLLDNKAEFPSGPGNAKRHTAHLLHVLSDPVEVARRLVTFVHGVYRGALLTTPVIGRGSLPFIPFACFVVLLFDSDADTRTLVKLDSCQKMSCRRNTAFAKPIPLSVRAAVRVCMSEDLCVGD